MNTTTKTQNTESANPSIRQSAILSRKSMNVVIVGHVDHGKSTVIGRLMADTGSLPEGKLEQVKLDCERNAKPFEYAFLLDALHDEQDQGITIDAARVFFKTPKRDYIIIDAPGHIEFLKNMITGAARAEAALLVIDADEGVQENSRRHGYMLSMLGIKQVVVVVNKMDLVNYNQDVFEKIQTEYAHFLQDIGMEARAFIPVSGREGDNVAENTANLAWFKGGTVLDVLDEFEKQKPAIDKPFRMPVQGVYKFTQNYDNRRIVSGTVESGTLKPGDEVVFYPSGKRSTVKAIEAFNVEAPDQIQPGDAFGFTLDEQIYITRGELAAKDSETRPEVSGRIRVSLFWLGRKPLKVGQTLKLKLGTTEVSARLSEIHKVINASNLDQTAQDRIQRHEVAECEFKLKKPLAFDLTGEFESTSRFVLVKDYEIQGGGIIREAVKDQQTSLREKVLERNLNWVTSEIPREQRANRYNQQATLLFVTGEQQSGKKTFAKHLERVLFSEGKHVYFIGIGNLLHGLDSDLEHADESDSEKQTNRQEHMRRLAEVAHLMLDAGMILIVTAVNLNEDDLSTIKTGLLGDQHQVLTLRLGDSDVGLRPDLSLPAWPDAAEASDAVIQLLHRNGSIFRFSD